MNRLLIAALTLAFAPATAAPDASWIVGTWRVVGCATSPRDPANCAHGDIAFDAKRFSIVLPCCKQAGAYTVVSATADVVAVDIDGRRSEIRRGTDGRARWTPGGLGGRVGELSFVRSQPTGK